MYETMEFGRFIRELREKQSLSQEAVDQRGGPSRQVIGELENGHDLAPSEATLRKLDQGLGLPSGLLRSILTCSGRPASEYFDSARARSISPECLALHCDSGEEMEWPDSLLVGAFDCIQDRLLDAGKSLLINVDAFPAGNAESGAGHYFIRRWSESFAAADAVRSTTLRAGLYSRGVVDALPEINTLQQARKLLATVESHSSSRWYPSELPVLQDSAGPISWASMPRLPHVEAVISNLDNEQEFGAALAALFVAYVAFSTDVSAFDVLDRIKLGGPGLFPTTDVQRTPWTQQRQSESNDADTCDETALDGRIAQLWGRFRNAVGLTADYGQRPDIEALYAHLGEALRQRREIVNVVLPSGGGGTPTRSEVTVWPLRDVVRTMPGMLLYDGRRFKSLPALWQWSWEENNPGARYWHVTSTARPEVGNRGAKVVSVGVNIDELIEQRFIGLEPGEAALSHWRGFEGGRLAVLTLAKSQGLESHPVFLPESAQWRTSRAPG